jgi:hypothetical protein
VYGIRPANSASYSTDLVPSLKVEINFLCVANTLAYSVGTLIEMDKSYEIGIRLSNWPMTFS